MKIRFWLPGSAAIQETERLPATFRGLTVLENTGGKYVDQPCEIELIAKSPVPEAIRISIMSEHRSYYSNGLRIPGLYKLGSAQLVLQERQDETYGSHGHETLTCRNQAFTCEGSSYDEVRELVMRVKAGSIRPSISYSEKQVEPLPRQFYDWLVAGIGIFKRDVLRLKNVY